MCAVLLEGWSLNERFLSHRFLRRFLCEEIVDVDFLAVANYCKDPSITGGFGLKARQQFLEVFRLFDLFLTKELPYRSPESGDFVGCSTLSGFPSCTEGDNRLLCFGVGCGC